MGSIRSKTRRFALPHDAVYMVSKIKPTDSDDELESTVIPIRLWDCFEDWLEGTPIDAIADRLNVTMREMDQILRQLVTEKIANVQKKSHERREKKKNGEGHKSNRKETSWSA